MNEDTPDPDQSRPEPDDPEALTRRDAVRAGLRDIVPMLVAIVPFGLLAGAAPVAAGLDVSHAVGLSVIVFAGASQFAITDVWRDGGGAVLAVVTALAVNARMLLYSASLAPSLSAEPLRRRLQVAYLLTDQAYALSIVRWTGDDQRRLRLPYYFAVGLGLWAPWQVATLVGALAGSRLPDVIPFEFSIPLIFLVLLVPAVRWGPSTVAAVTGGAVAVAANETAASRMAVLLGGLAGIAAGAVAEIRAEHRAQRPR